MARRSCWERLQRVTSGTQIPRTAGPIPSSPCTFFLSPRIAKGTAVPSSGPQSLLCPWSLHRIVEREANNANPGSSLLAVFLSLWSRGRNGESLKGTFQGNGSKHLPFVFGPLETPLARSDLPSEIPPSPPLPGQHQSPPCLDPRGIC